MSVLHFTDISPIASLSFLCSFNSFGIYFFKTNLRSKQSSFSIVLYFGGFIQLLNSLVAFTVNDCLFYVLGKRIETVTDFPLLPAEY